MPNSSDNVVPSLGEDDPTPASGPVAKSMSQARRIREQQKDKPEPVFTGRVYKKFRVVRDTEVPKGGASFFLAGGQVISEQHYDIDALRIAGVPLEELPST